MRKSIAIILMLCVTAAFAGCGQQTNGTVPQGQTAPSASATQADYTNTDFSGHWAVTAVYDQAGNAISSDKISELGSFTLELLTDGTYFVYDASGAVLGQGSYLVNKDVMTLSAGGVQTLYTVMDKDTLRGAAADGSVTVLVRQPEETPAVDEEEPGETGEDADVSETPEDVEEDIDIPDEETDIPEDGSTATATPEPDASTTPGEA